MTDLQKYFQQGGYEMLRKALTASDPNSGQALIPQFLEKLITNTAIRLVPSWEYNAFQYGAQRRHEFNYSSALGVVGGAQGEMAAAVSNNSTNNRTAVDLKVIRRPGTVTWFLKESSAAYIDALAYEIERQITAQVYSLSLYSFFGNEQANSYEFTGRDTYIKTNRFQDGFTTGTPTLLSDLKYLDKMVAASNRAGGYSHRRAWIMSPEMAMRIRQLTTTVLQYQEVGKGRQEPGVGIGYYAAAYLDIPILPSSFTGGIGATQMGTVTATSGGTTGGSFSDGTYGFRVEVIDDKGQGMAAAKSSVTLSGGTATQKVTLSFTAVNNALWYRVYFSATNADTDMKLVKVVCAQSYDGTGAVTGGISSISVLAPTADTTVTNTSSSTSSFAPDMSGDFSNRAVSSVNSENIYLIDFDAIQGLGKMPYCNVGDRAEGPISLLRLPPSYQGENFSIYSHVAIAPSYEATSCVSRGWLAA